MLCLRGTGVVAEVGEEPAGAPEVLVRLAEPPQLEEQRARVALDAGPVAGVPRPLEVEARGGVLDQRAVGATRARCNRAPRRRSGEAVASPSPCEACLYSDLQEILYRRARSHALRATMAGAPPWVREGDARLGGPAIRPRPLSGFSVWPTTLLRRRG